MRLFVAVDLPEDLRARLGGLQDELRPIPLPVRWVRPQGIHLTLKFLGEVAQERAPAIGEALRAVAGEHAPFTLSVAGVGVFPELGAPRVIWVGLGGDLPAAGRLQDAIDAALLRLGFAREKRPFRPHLTLGRVKGAGRGDWRPLLRRHAEASLGSFEAPECVLFESKLDSAGASYSPIGRFPLSASGGE